jgi:predicted nucleic acid-binding protein
MLIYAFRADSARHAPCKSWLDGIVLGEARFGISPLSLSAVARIATNPRIFRQPSSVEETFAFLRQSAWAAALRSGSPWVGALVDLHPALPRSEYPRASHLGCVVRSLGD